MPGAELVRRIAFAAEGQSVPGGVKRADADDPGGQDEVEIRVARRDIVKPVEVFDVGGREVAATAKIVVNLGVFEILIAGGLVECIDKLPVERGRKDFSGVVGGKNQVRVSAFRLVPDRGVVEVHVLHGPGGRQKANGLQVGADLENPRPGQREVGFVAPRSAVHRKSAVGLHQDFEGLLRQARRSVKKAEAHLPLAADAGDGVWRGGCRLRARLRRANVCPRIVRA